MPYKDRERQLAAQRAWYQANKSRVYRRHCDRPNAEYVKKQKENPCVDCGVRYPHYVMQFDHIGTDKVGSVSKVARSAGLEKLKLEIAKCELVCANCHAIRTWQRIQ